MRHFTSLPACPLPFVAFSCNSVPLPSIFGNSVPDAPSEIIPHNEFITSYLPIHNFELGNEKPMTLLAILQHEIKASIMIDSGASTSFVDESFIKKHNLVPRKKAHPETVHVADGRQSSSGKITHEIDLSLAINSHIETLTLQATRIARYDVILGKSWLSKHDPKITWSNNELLFNSNFCLKFCNIIVNRYQKVFGYSRFSSSPWPTSLSSSSSSPLSPSS